MRRNNLNDVIDMEGVEGLLCAIGGVLLFGLVILLFAPIIMSVVSLFKEVSVDDIGFAFIGGVFFIGFGGMFLFANIAEKVEAKSDKVLYDIAGIAWVIAALMLVVSGIVPMTITTLVVTGVLEIVLVGAFVVDLMF